MHVSARINQFYFYWFLLPINNKCFLLFVNGLGLIFYIAMCTVNSRMLLNYSLTFFFFPFFSFSILIYILSGIYIEIKIFFFFFIIHNLKNIFFLINVSNWILLCNEQCRVQSLDYINEGIFFIFLWIFMGFFP